MAITGAVGAALRQEAPFQAEIQMGAQLIMDFQGARSGRRPYYWYRGTRYTRPEKIPGWSFSRGSVGCAEDSAGNLIAFPANEPRITDLGFLIEESRQQSARNNRFQDWTGVVPAGYGSQIAGRVAKVPGVFGDNALRINGPFSNDGNRVNVPSMPELAGSTAYTFRARVRRVRGAAARLVFTMDSWGAVADLNLSGVALGQWTTVSVTATSSPSTAGGGGFHTGGADCDIEIDWWQFEAGSFPTSFIINDTLAAATRAADSAYIAGLGAILTAPFTLVTKVATTGDTGIAQWAVQADDGTNNNRVVLQRAASGLYQSQVTESGSATVLQSVPNQTGARAMQMAARVRPVVSRGAYNGVLDTDKAKVAPSGLSRLVVGSNSGNSVPFNGFIQLVGVFADSDDVQLARLTA